MLHKWKHKLISRLLYAAEFMCEPAMLTTDHDNLPKMHCAKRNVLSFGSFAKKVKREIKLNVIPRVLYQSLLLKRNNIAHVLFY